MTEASSGKFSSFWQRGVDKVSNVKFMPNVTKPHNGKDGEEADDSTLTQKERRRAQVRKAQIEHRQRKENYVKHLEQDVINLREMIAVAETQAAIFRHENTSIKTTLTKSNITITGMSTSVTEVLPQQQDFSHLNTFQQNSLQNSFSPPTGLRDFQWPSQPSSNSTLVSMSFDEFIGAPCLQINPTDFDINMSDADAALFSFTSSDYAAPITITAPTPDLSKLNPAFQKALPKLPDEPATPVVGVPQAAQDLSTVAINFILALEHPCRTHFHAHTSEFNPTGSPSGHELMASTILYSHAPEPIFTSLPDLFPTCIQPTSDPAPSSPPKTTTWTMPKPSLSALHDMASSLPKGDWEITPVQAWFLLMGKYDVRKLLTEKEAEQGKERVIEGLKRGLGGLVSCFEFGAVMDEARFWEVVDRELE